MAASITTTPVATAAPVADLTGSSNQQENNAALVPICDRSSSEEAMMLQKQIQALLTSANQSELTEWLVKSFMNQTECLEMLKQATEDAIRQVQQASRASNSLPEDSPTTRKVLEKKPSLEEVVAEALTGLRQSEPLAPQAEQMPPVQQQKQEQQQEPTALTRITPKRETSPMEDTMTAAVHANAYANAAAAFSMANQHSLDLWKNVYNAKMKMNMAAAGNLLQTQNQHHHTTAASTTAGLTSVLVPDVPMDEDASPSSSMTPVPSTSNFNSANFSFVRGNGLASPMKKKCLASKAMNLMVNPNMVVLPTDPLDTPSTPTGGSSVKLETAQVLMNRASRAQPTSKAVPRRWTKDEDEALRKAVRMHQEKNWKAIAVAVPGRNHTQCLQRWTKVLAPGLVKGHWSKYEDDLLKRLVASENKNWGEVAAKIPGRTSKQCRERWHNHLDPSIIRGAYTPEEDRIIIEAQAKLGNRWSVIAAMLPGRTEDAVKIRWKSHCRLWKTKQQPEGAEVTAGEKREREEDVEEDAGTDDTGSTTCPSEPNSPTSKTSVKQQEQEQEEDAPCKKKLKTEIS